MNFKKQIVIVTDYDLHLKSGAAFSRVSCYQGSLKDSYNFYSCEFNQFYQKRDYTEFITCELSSINFLPSKNRNDNYLYRNALKLFDFITPMRMICFIRKNFSESNSIILLYSSNFFLFIFTIVVLRFIGRYKVVIEKNEIESGIVLNSGLPANLFIIPFLVIFPFRLIFAILIDIFAFAGNSIIAISRNIYSIYSLNSNVYLIPILVDIDRLRPHIKDVKNRHFIRFIYLGALTAKKDAIFKVLEAFNELKNNINNHASLSIIGEGSYKVKDKISNFILKNALGEIVKLCEPIKSHEVPDVLLKNDVGILLRERNIQTCFGFSTKLAEYLAAGLPVLTNDISDNALYLHDGLDSFFVESVSVEQISSKILEIIEKRDQLSKISKNANDVAKTNFEYSIYNDKLKRIF